MFNILNLQLDIYVSLSAYDGIRFWLNRIPAGVLDDVPRPPHRVPAFGCFFVMLIALVSIVWLTGCITQEWGLWIFIEKPRN